MGKNKIKITNCNIEKSKIQIKGTNNLIIAQDTFLTDCLITITGIGNRLIIENGVKLRKGTIHIRGSNCSILIGKRTSFGQVRMVNVGIDNNISIGQDCLFADNIEIWASDTHSIYDKEGKFLNPEKPITIANKVWIGSYVKILKGVSIGENAVVGMNSFVTKNIDANTLCAGNPLKVLKKDIHWSLKYENETY